MAKPEPVRNFRNIYLTRRIIVLIKGKNHDDHSNIQHPERKKRTL